MEATSNENPTAVASKGSGETEEGEICDEEEGVNSEEEDDPFYCDSCNMKLNDKKAYMSHLNSVSHLTKNSQAFQQATQASFVPQPVPPVANPPTTRPGGASMSTGLPHRLAAPWAEGRQVRAPEMSHQTRVPEISHPPRMPPGMGQQSRMPGMSPSSRMPEMSRQTRMPEMSHSSRMPEMSHQTRMPEMSHRARMPEASHSLRMSEMSHSTRMPDSHLTRTPGTPGAQRMRQLFPPRHPVRAPVPLMSVHVDAPRQQVGETTPPVRQATPQARFERPPVQQLGVNIPGAGNLSGVRQPLLSPRGGRGMQVRPNVANPPGGMVRPGPRGVEPPQRPVRPLAPMPPQRPTTASQGPPVRQIMAHSPPIVPLIDGRWSIDRSRLQQVERFICEVCSEDFKNSIAHVIHLAGLRHKKAVYMEEQRRSQMIHLKNPPGSQINAGVSCTPVSNTGPGSEAVSASMSVSAAAAAATTAEAAAAATAAQSSAVLTTAQSSIPAPKPVPKRQLAEFELSLYRQKDAVLGFDYVTEFQHKGKLPSTKQSEFVCDLCDLTFLTPEGITQHVTSTNHILLYLEYHDPELYKTVEEEKISRCKVDRELLKEVASQAEEKLKCRYRMRVKVQADEKSADDASEWKEVEDELVRPVVDLPGHRLSLGYSVATASNHIDDLRVAAGQTEGIDVLLKGLTTLDTLTAGRPPSWVKPIDRLELLKALVAHEVKNDMDADVCLQLANSMTVALLQYRLKQIPSMDAIDTTKLSDKLTELCRTADAVSEKIQLIDANLTVDAPTSTPNSG